jgi:serine/threonine protein kinase
MEIAMKIARGSGERYTQKFVKERVIYKRFAGPAIIECIPLRDNEGKEIKTISINKNPYEVIFMEKCEGDLGSSRIDSLKQLTDGVSSLCDLLRRMHGNENTPEQERIFLRDIKPSNLLIDNKNRIKITDAGEATAPDTYKTSGRPKGAKHYRIPEAFEDEKGYLMNAPHSDIYQLGVSLWDILYVYLNPAENQEEISMFEGPESRLIEQKMSREYLDKRIELIAKGELNKFPGILEAIAKSVSPNPADRYRSAEEFKMDFVPLFREFNASYKPFREALDHLVVGSEYPVMNMESAKNVVLLKDRFDEMVARNGLASYTPAKIIREWCSRDDLNAYVFLKWCETQEITPDNCPDKNLAEKIEKANQDFSTAPVAIKRSMMEELFPFHQDQWKDFYLKPREDQEAILDSIEKKNGEHVAKLLAEGKITEAELKMRIDYYSRLEEMFCIL